MGLLAKKLRSQNYDLIDGPNRNHGLLQVWRKLEFQPVEWWRNHISEGFNSTVEPREFENPGLSVTSKDKHTYKFNIGVSALEAVLNTLNMGDLKLDAKISGGKTLTVSYDDTVAREVPIGELFDFFDKADFASSSPKLYQQLNNDRFIVISGVLQAKNLNVSIETDSDISADVVASLNEVVSGKADFSLTGDRELKMVAPSDDSFPVAVKAHRVFYQKGKFNDVRLLTDNRFFF